MKSLLNKMKKNQNQLAPLRPIRFIIPNKCKTTSRSCKPIRPITSKQLKPIKKLTKEEKMLNWNSAFDKLINDSSLMSTTKAIESNLRVLFQSQKCIFWQIDLIYNVLYSETNLEKIGVDDTLQGFVFQNRTTLSMVKKESLFNERISEVNSMSSGFPIMLFPIVCNNESYGVVQLVREPVASNAFAQEDNECASFIIDKMKIYGRKLFTSADLFNISLNLFTMYRPNQQYGSTKSSIAAIDPTEALTHIFDCDGIDIFKFDLIRGNVSAFETFSLTMCPVTTDNCGVAAYCANTKQIINIVDIKKHPSYCKNVDGDFVGAFLCAPYEIEPKVVWVVCIRGRSYQFTSSEELILQAITPFVVKSIIGFYAIKPKTSFDFKLMELNKFSVIFNNTNLRSKELYSKIEDAIKILIECDKSIFLLYDEEKNKFYGKWYLKHPQESDADTGIASIILKSNEVLNVNDPRCYSCYNAQTDSYEGYENKCTLGKSIVGVNGKIYGVILAIGNSVNSFEADDVKAIQAFSVIAGIALQNYECGGSIAKFVALTENYMKDSSKEEEFVSYGMKSCGFSRITLFSVSEGSLKDIKNYGRESNIGSLLAAECFEKKSQIIFSAKELDERGITFTGKEIHNDKLHLISQCFQETQEAPEEDANTVGIVDKLIIDEESYMIIGIIEAEFFGKYLRTNELVLDAIEQHVVKKYFEEIRQKTAQNDKEEIQITGYTNAKMFDISFESSECSLNDSINIYIAVFEKFGIFKEFSIDINLFVQFINTVLKQTGQNCTRLLDIFQFAALSIKTSKCYTVIGLQRTYIMLLTVFLRFIAPIDAIKLLGSIDITGQKKDSDKSYFIKEVIICMRDSELSNFMKSKKRILDVLNSGEFDPTSSEEHMDIIIITVSVSAQAGILARPQVSKKSADMLCREFQEIFKDDQPLELIVYNTYIPLLDFLGKEMKSLNFIGNRARENFKAILNSNSSK